MQAGEQVTSNLRLVRQLGQGGMGAVWVADHLTLGTQVAVKFMWRQFAEHPQFIERFRREASAAAMLKNPHVAQVFDHGVTPGGEPFIVMELLEGEDLGKRVKREGPLPPAVVAEILVQAAKALGKAHQLGMVHRDIKADNLFLMDVGGELFVKVLDFGIAKVRGDGNVSMTSTGGTIGTPLFMSPEQLLSAKHVDHRADQWSLGVVAYYALTKRVPFPGETIGAISVAVHTGEFAPPSSVRPELPTEVDAWFRRVFRRNPDERFASVKEMAEAFRAALAGRVTSPPIIDVAAPGPDLSDAQATVALPPLPAAVVDTSPRTLGGKAVTIGERGERRRWAVPALLLTFVVVAVIVSAAVVRPWQKLTAQGGAASGSGAVVAGPGALPESSGSGVAATAALTTSAPSSGSSESAPGTATGDASAGDASAPSGDASAPGAPSGTASSGGSSGTGTGGAALPGTARPTGGKKKPAAKEDPGF